MKKKLLYIFLFSIFPVASYAATITTNTTNVPIHVKKNNSQVIITLPTPTTVTKNSSSGEWYQITYNNNTGWINRAYTVEGANEIQTEKAKLSVSSSPSYSSSASSSSSSSTKASYTSSGSFTTKTEKMQQIVAAAQKYGKQYDLDPYLILALIKVESSFNPNACSSANCRGLMQISYKYAPSWGIDKSRLYEIDYNIQHGTRLLKTNFIKGMGGNTYDGLRAYNQGVNGAKKSSSNGKAYADKIMKYYNNYKKNGFTG